MPPRLSGSRAQHEDTGRHGAAGATARRDQGSGRMGISRNPGRPTPPRAKVEAAMGEVHRNIPSTVTRADVSGERREKMLRAIAFSKARKGQ